MSEVGIEREGVSEVEEEEEISVRRRSRAGAGAIEGGV